MSSDERAIRELVERWLAATKAGDTATVLSLMADDVVFMVPGREPFGKEAFAAQSNALRGAQIEGRSDILELEVHGNWAWLRSRLRVTVTPPGAKPATQSGYTLTLFRKLADGRWVLTRDANLLTPDQPG